MGDSTIYLSQHNTETTVCFLMLGKHLLFTLLILSFLCSLQAQHKVYRCRMEIYRDSAIPCLPRWAVHGKNLGKVWASMKVRCVLLVFFTVDCNFSTRIMRIAGKNPQTRCTDPRQRFTGTLPYPICQNGNRETLNV